MISLLSSQLSSVKKEMEVLEGELQTVRDTYNNKQDIWIKEKLQIQVHYHLFLQWRLVTFFSGIVLTV